MRAAEGYERRLDFPACDSGRWSDMPETHSETWPLTWRIGVSGSSSRLQFCLRFYFRTQVSTVLVPAPWVTSSTVIVLPSADTTPVDVIIGWPFNFTTAV